MSGEGRPEQYQVDASGLSVGIVATRWNDQVVEPMLENALEVAKASGAATPVVVEVAGAVEIPVVAQELARNHDAVIASQFLSDHGNLHRSGTGSQPRRRDRPGC